LYAAYRVHGYRDISTAVASFKNLNEEENMIWRLYFYLSRFWHQYGSTHQYEDSLPSQVNRDMTYRYANNTPSSHQRGLEIYFNSQSLADQTLSRYVNTTLSTDDKSPILMPNCRGRDGQ